MSAEPCSNREVEARPPAPRDFSQISTYTVGWLVGWLVGGLVGWWIGGLVGGLVGWLVEVETGQGRGLSDWAEPYPPNQRGTRGTLNAKRTGAAEKKVELQFNNTTKN